MHRSDDFPAPFRLNHWLVQPDLNRITGPDGPVGIEPRVMKVLLVLAARPGEVVHRNDLLDTVWADAIVGEEILTRAVSELRRVFGDRARNPEYIETIRQHGYRLIAPVTPVEPGEPAATPTEAPAAEPVPAPPPATSDPASAPAGPGRTPGIPRSLVLVLAGLVLVAIVFAPRIIREVKRPDGTGPTGPPGSDAVPLTTFPGRELHPALSPDGTRVAFVWAGPDGDNADLYVKQRNSETPLRLTDDPGWVAWPAWSPDGQTLAFVQGADTGSVLGLIPSLGGAIRQVHRSPGWIEGVDWSPAGDRLVFSAPGEDRFTNTLWFLDLDDLRVTPFAVESYVATGRFQPRFSPDGAEVAWIGLGPAGRSHVVVATVDGAEYRRVAGGPAPIQGLAWTPDGRFLVYGSSPNGRFALWKAPVAGGEPVWIPTPGDLAWNPAIARETGDLVFEQVRMDQDIWRVSILGRAPWQLGTGPFLASTRWEGEADFHPAGDRVVFVSSRSGAPELWVCDADGANLRPVTELGAATLNNPRWSPAGDRIAFNAVADGVSRVMIVPEAGGAPREIGAGTERATFTAWAADGASLLVVADDGLGGQIHRLPLAGGESTALTRRGGSTAAESPDGAALWFTRPTVPGLWRVALRDGRPAGEPARVFEDLDPRDARHWRLATGPDGVTGVVHVARMDGEAFLGLYDLEDETSSFLTDLPGLSDSGLAVSPGGDVILFARIENQGGDLLLIRSFSPR